MRRIFLYPIRPSVVLVCLVLAFPAFAESAPQDQSAPQGQPSPQGQTTPQKATHLKEWVAVHSALTLPQLLDALEREPGFQQFPPSMQQKLRDRAVEDYKLIHPKPVQPPAALQLITTHS